MLLRVIWPAPPQLDIFPLLLFPLAFPTSFQHVGLRNSRCTCVCLRVSTRIAADTALGMHINANSIRCLMLDASTETPRRAVFSNAACCFSIVLDSPYACL